MSSSISYQSFEPIHLKPLHEAFLKAFENYFTAFQPSLDQFQHRIFNKLNINEKYSELAWVDDQVVGFILHASGQYRGKSTLYNGGTGVIPSFQRQSVAHHLYENILRKIVDQGRFDQLVLEVIDKNVRAIKFYESLGFQFARELKCFALKGVKINPNEIFRLEESLEYKPKQYGMLLNYNPSFMDAWPHLKSGLVGETILEAYDKNDLKGFVVFNPNLGRISQLGIGTPGDKSVTQVLLAEAQQLSHKDLTIINISIDDLELVTVLESIGFVNELTQFEMDLVL